MRLPRTTAFCAALVLLPLLLFRQQVFAGATTFTSDDFNSHNLKRPLWTLFNPGNDAALLLQGVNTSNARLHLTVPAGSSHDIWTTGNTAPRIMQNAANEDFSVEVKFESPLTGVIFDTYAAQGILVESDPNNLIRFDFTTGNEDSTKVFAAVFSGGFSSPSVRISRNVRQYNVAPMWLRVHRVGNNWTMLYSFNGSTYDTAGTFTQAITVTKIGLFSINAGVRPSAHTMIADYFFNMDAANPPEDGATGVTDLQGPLVHSVRVQSAPNAFRVSWKTDEPADGVVEFGSVLPYANSVSHPGYFADHRLTVTGLTAGTVYNYRVQGTDAASNTDGTGNATVSTSAYVLDTTTVSDDFNGTTLDAGIWTYTNPRSDATLSVSGKRLTINVPGGVSHEPWTSGNTAPRITQPVDASTNVGEYVAKFVSIPNGSGTSVPMQGIYVEQDSVNFVRMDVYHDGSNLYGFVASFIDGFASPDVFFNVPVAPGSGPLYLKAYRGGALWTFSYSYDGIAWTDVGNFFRVITARRVGVFAGNSGSSPAAFSCIVDFFRGAVPARPVQVAPANGATGVPLPVAISWDTTAGAQSYRLQVSTVANFATTVFDSVLTGTSRNFSNLLTTTLYYWRVRAVSGTLLSAYSTTWNFTTAQPAPGAPALVSPADNALDVPAPAPLAWTRPATAVSFRLQVGTDSTFASGIVVNDSTITDTSAAAAGLASSTRYFWRVNAKNAGGTGPYSAVRRFTTAPAVPPVPVLFSPADGSIDKAIDLSLIWRRSLGAASYHIQVASDAGFTAIVVNDSSVADTARAVAGLAYSTQYFWRVGAANAGGKSSFAAAFSFTTVVAPPGAPQLVSPANGATGQSSAVTFRWTRPAGATAFRLQVATDQTFASGLVVNDSTITDTLRAVGGLNYNTQFYWRVQALNAGGGGVYSSTYNFRTLASDPTVPVQITPVDLATNQPTALTVRWTRPSGATSFHLQVSTDSTFASALIVDDPTLTDTSRALSSLSFLTTYYWRVNADNVGGTSPWSPVWRFTVGITLPDQVQLVSPADQALFASPTVGFIWRASQPAVNRYWFELSIDPGFAFRTVDSTLTDTVKVSTGLSPSTTYYWRVRAGNPGGWGPYSAVRSFTVTTVDVAEDNPLPTEFGLNQNYPNPFNPSTEIQFALPHDSRVRLAVYNLLGEEVATLVNDRRPAGYHTVRFDAAALSSGIYLYRLETDNVTFTRKMMLVK